MSNFQDFMLSRTSGTAASGKKKKKGRSSAAHRTEDPSQVSLNKPKQPLDNQLFNTELPELISRYAKLVAHPWLRFSQEVAEIVRSIRIVGSRVPFAVKLISNSIGTIEPEGDVDFVYRPSDSSYIPIEDTIHNKSCYLTLADLDFTLAHYLSRLKTLMSAAKSALVDLSDAVDRGSRILSSAITSSIAHPPHPNHLSALDYLLSLHSDLSRELYRKQSIFEAIDSSPSLIESKDWLDVTAYAVVAISDESSDSMVEFAKISKAAEWT